MIDAVATLMYVHIFIDLSPTSFFIDMRQIWPDNLHHLSNYSLYSCLLYLPLNGQVRSLKCLLHFQLLFNFSTYVDLVMFLG